MTKQKGCNHTLSLSVLVNALTLHECLVRRFFADLNGQKQFFTDSGGAPCVQKKEGAAKHRVLHPPPFLRFGWKQYNFFDFLFDFQILLVILWLVNNN